MCVKTGGVIQTANKIQCVTCMGLREQKHTYRTRGQCVSSSEECGEVVEGTRGTCVCRAYSLLLVRQETIPLRELRQPG